MKVEYIVHKIVDNEVLSDIIKVKSAAWDYSEQEQLSWIEDNVKDDDIHVLLYDNDNKIQAYLNLIKIDFHINEVNYSGYGVGNVCALKKNSGLGSHLIQEVNQYLVRTNSVGLLFCKGDLPLFYAKNGWSLIAQDEVHIKYATEKIQTMLFNCKLEIADLSYAGKLF